MLSPPRSSAHVTFVAVVQFGVAPHTGAGSSYPMATRCTCCRLTSCLESVCVLAAPPQPKLGCAPRWGVSTASQASGWLWLVVACSARPCSRPDLEGGPVRAGLVRNTPDGEGSGNHIVATLCSTRTSSLKRPSLKVRASHAGVHLSCGGSIGMWVGTTSTVGPRPFCSIAFHQQFHFVCMYVVRCNPRLCSPWWASALAL